MAIQCSFPGCRSFTPKGGLCVSHAKYFGGTTIKEEKPKAIPAKSSKRKEDEKEYRKIAKQVLKENPLCAAKLKGCTGKATQCHHSAGRLGGNYLNKKKLLPVCQSCHLQIELTPIKSKELKLSESRLNN